MRQRKSRRSRADHQHALSGRSKRQRATKIERIPPRQQRVNLEAPRQGQHILEHPCLCLRDVDGILLLINAGLHAIVADAVAGRGNQGVVDADHRQGAKRPAFGAQLVEFGNLFVQRAAGENHAERRLLERRR